MLPRIHLTIGLIISTILFFIFPQIGILGIAIIFLFSFLIDIDHYFYFIHKKNSFNLKKAYLWFREKGRFLKKFPIKERKKFSTGFYCFHGIEIIIILLILGIFVSKYFLYILIGISLHLVLDWIELVHSKKRIFKISLIYDYFKNRKLKSI